MTQPFGCGASVLQGRLDVVRDHVLGINPSARLARGGIARAARSIEHEIPPFGDSSAWQRTFDVLAQGVLWL